MYKNLKKFLKNYYFLSFLLGALAYYMFLAYSQMAGGKYILLEGDTLDGVVPAIKTFYDNLLNGEKINYTWTSELGINAYVNLATVMLFNISAPFYLLLHNVDYTVITVIILVVKAGITSLCFYFYMDKIWHTNGINGLIFSVCYSMCAFWVVYIPLLIMFADAIYMLPIILYCVSKYADEGKYKIMCIAYVYLFLNFYYSAYIVGFFSLFYLILYMILCNKYTITTIFKKLCFFGVCVIISAGMTAIVLYPMALFLLTKYAEDATVMVEAMDVNLLDMYNQLYIGQVCGIYNEYPYLYCGLPVLLIFPFYLFNKKIDFSERIVWISLLVLMVISCLFLPLYLFWHCFDAPDGVPYRFSFIISFIICLMASRQSKYILDYKKRKLFVWIIINAYIYIVCMYIQPLYQDEFYNYSLGTWLYFIINLVFMIVYYVWLCLFDKYKGESKNKNGLECLIIFLVIVELVINGYSGYYKPEFIHEKNNTETYNLWKNTVTEALNDISKDGDGFYRISSQNDYIVNAPLFFDYNGIASFSNLENYEVRKTLGNLGLLTSPRLVLCNGLTDFTRMILSVGYDINNVKINNRSDYVVDNNKHAVVLKNEYMLSLGFLVDRDIKDFMFSGRNQFRNINELAECMMGEKIVLYDLLTEGVELHEVGINVYKNEDGNFAFIYNPIDENNYGLLYFSIPLDDRNAFVQFDYGQSEYDAQAPLITDGYSGTYNKYERLSTSFIKPMTRADDGFMISVLMLDNFYYNISAPENVNFAYYNEESFLELYNNLKEGQMEILDYRNGYVHGKIDVYEDDKVLFTSIPYDTGWKVFVNGQPYNYYSLIEGAFIGMDLPKGSYDIEFKYYTPGVKTGFIITVIFILMYIVVCLMNIKLKVKRMNYSQVSRHDL